MKYGRQTDELFEKFIDARSRNDIEKVQEVLSSLDSLSYEQQSCMTELREEIDEFLNEAEMEMECY